MLDFIAIILFFVFIYLLIAIIKPSTFLKFTKMQFSRGKTALFAFISLVLFLATITAAAPDETAKGIEDGKSTTAVAEADANDAVDAKAKADEKAKKEAGKKAKEEAEKKAKEEAAAKKKAEEEAKAKAEAEAALARSKNPEWNTAELDAMENGNIHLAIDMLKAIKNEPVTPIQADAGSVFKTPWNYYGKPVEFTLYVAIVQDYPPDSETGQIGMLSEVVGTTEDGTIIDVIGLVPSGDIAVGDEITIVAYPVGHVTVDNKLGGQTDQLSVVTNKY
ncbi:hypothetical protein [Paenibacillus crassostreae]|uniref:Uncharacterized protein n=1 Tax=Paenibacillus crassostreae TaxID=1763538 RepID=A0A167AUK9_9BACL|nr:hypothetical protein [Paenibacillus crassostreae]AOZ93620.1 hypothetical protein LPB68_16425 [Paenibacillus crassostreae]OAB71447.1 hypothetical protein PNBC_19295 [Paenibacillus crassostreae]